MTLSQYTSVLLFVILLKVVLTFENENENLKTYRLNEGHCAVYQIFKGRASFYAQLRKKFHLFLTPFPFLIITDTCKVAKAYKNVHPHVLEKRRLDTKNSKIKLKHLLYSIYLFFCHDVLPL